MKKFISVFVAVVTALSFTGCGQTATSENKNLEKVTVVLDWTPNTNHTGLYVAKEKGYFEDAGLDVEIQQPPEDGATLMVSSGKAQFGIDFQEYLAPAFKPGEEMNVSAVAAIIQHNTSGLISLKEKGIDSPKKLEGKTYATWDMDIEKSIIKKFRKSVWCKFTKAIREYELVKDGDKIAVCISGGKDSMLMAKLFQELRKHGKANFELVFLVMNPGYNADNWKIIQDNAKVLGIPLTVFESNIFDTVADIDKNPCYLCARMRRGYLYSHAKELGCNKIALGHHYDDVIETILMGMLYSGKIETMMPKLHSTNFEGMELIRPMYLIKEADIIGWRDYNQLNFIQCACRFTENCATCGGGRGSKRDEMKELIAQFREESNLIEKNIFRSVHNVNLRTIIGYHKDDDIYNFLHDYDERGKKKHEKM